MKVGIDVGGTHTDAVILTEKNELVAAFKTPTTPDVTTGIINALDLALENSGVSPKEIKYVMIGTTHCINAITERRRLARVGVIRIGLPAGTSIPPMADWPEDLRGAIGEAVYVLPGGFEYDGRRLGRFDEGLVEKAVKDASEKGVEAFAVSGIFSPVNGEQEIRAAEIIRDVAGEEFPVSLSHEIGSLGFIERENATILNAALHRVAKVAADSIEKACKERGIKATIYFSQNDGTLMSVEYARRYPILTIASGPTNSFRGAVFLTGLTDTLVVDIGGTTMLVGAMIKGFPRQSATAVYIGGVRTNFRMPDLLSIGCGGGSIVRTTDSGEIRIGPDSLGYEIIRKSKAWGGDTITTTDIALAAGYARIEDPNCRMERLKGLDPNFVEAAVKKIVSTLETAIDKIKTSKEPVPVVLVGGGGIIIPPEMYDKLSGVSKVVRPAHFQYANAIGAAIAQVSGEVDRVFPLEEFSREEVLKKARELAIKEAVKAGADEETVEVVDIDEIYLSYLPSNAVRIRVKAAGRLRAA